ncbi:cardiolipin synthase [Winogradskyella jejuensis]|uniref:Cardiolipin synthase n=1 Tax=Winogradskyella jejuensis TaxID=1089305 RepID=A0A1M5SXV6_9FLAO|nr:cardiolipin synthase [Winogradskyella jejuensis]SHH43265.1 cardiolipin synthase [Winogradskyella jejuensis]
MDFIKNHIWAILTILNYIIAVSAVITILFKRINPTKTLSYIIALLLIPFLGLLVYYLFGQDYRKSKIFNRKKVLNQSTVKSIQETADIDAHVVDDIEDRLKEKSKLIPLIYNSENSKLTVNNKVTVIKDGDMKFDLLFKDIEKAKHHIHLEYFIVKDDDFGLKFLNVLSKKAKDGVQVKLIMDDVGSDVSNNTIAKLKESGVEVYKFMPVLFSKSTGKMNYRDHRKIVVIDGEIGYVGGINISNNYLNANKTSYFRDTHCRIEGEAVNQLQILFFTTWDFVTEKDLKVSSDYFPKIDDKGDTPVQISASGPDTDWSNIMEAIFTAITNASDYIYITTPYFIPNDEIVTALQVAARSNVKVKLLVPKKSDSWVAEYATNSYLERLLEAKIEVYRYTKGFIHAKTMVVDGMFSTIGTTNMDYRSFNINFEVNALFYDEKTSKRLEDLFIEDLESAEKMELDLWKNRNKRTKAIEAIANLMAPLL